MCVEISRLRDLRHRAHLTQGELAARIGWDKQRISRLERFPHRVTIQDAVKIAWALHLPAAAVYPILGASPPRPYNGQSPEETL